MIKFSNTFFVALLILAFTSCKNDSVTPTVNGLKGYIYYSDTRIMHRLDLNNSTNTTLFSNGGYPEITASGKILCVEKFPTRLIETDLTGANRKELVLAKDNTTFNYSRWIYHERISPNQQYIAYDGGKIENPVVYIINANDGSLVTQIGDWNTDKPFISPSWAPDGSLIVDGYTSTHNGIYKIAKDFKTATRLDPNLSNVSEPNISPDGKTIVFIRDGKLWIMNSDGTNPKQLYTSEENFSMPVWSPDSKYIATVEASGYIYILDLAKNTISQLNISHYVGSSEKLCWVY